MKKYSILVLLLFCLVRVGSSQILGFESRVDADENRKYNQEYHHRAASLHIRKAIAMVSKNDKAEKKYFETQLNADGQVVEYTDFNKRGQMASRTTYKYDGQGRLTEYKTINKKGLTRQRIVYVFDSAGNRTDVYNYLRKGREGVHNKATFDAKGNILNYKYYFDNDTRDYGWVDYSYYPDGSKKQTISYDRRGKIQHVWNFECNPSGKQENKKMKDTTGVCIRYETDGEGNKLKIEERHYSRGETIRSIAKYDKRNYCVESAGYNKKGKVTYRYVYNYDKNGDFQSQVTFKWGSDKIASKVVNELNAQGMVVSQTLYKDKPAPSKIIKFIYEKG